MIKKTNEFPNWRLLIIGIVLLLGLTYWVDIERERYEREYVSLGGRDTSEIKGVVSVYKRVKVWTGTSAIELTNGQKIIFSSPARNYLYKTPDFYDCIDIGDSIRRPSGYAGHDSIYLYKANEDFKQYHFIMGEIINEKY